MFDELDKQNAQPHPNPLLGKEREPNAPAPGKAEDILAEVDKTVKPEAFKPRLAGAPYETVVPADHSWLKHKRLIFSLIGGGLIIVAGGFMILKLMTKNNQAADLTAQEQTANETAAPAVKENNQAAPPPAVELNRAEVAAPSDSDADGLTDEEEIKIGTSPTEPDTDQDGLTDREENKVYGTNPLSADTDGDGYNDGDEIKNGFNPKGAGKFLNADNQ